MQTSKRTLIFLLAACSLIYSCKKTAQSVPSITLKTGAGFVSQNAVVTQGQTLTIGVTAQSSEDNLARISLSAEFDHNGSRSAVKSTELEPAEQEHCDKDFSITTRNKSGTETWIVTVEDRNGHSSHAEIELTVR